MKQTMLAILVLLLIFPLNSAQSFEIKKRIEVQPICYSNQVRVTRTDYLINTDLDKPLHIINNYFPYYLGVGKELNPYDLKIKDNYRNIYNISFNNLSVKDVCLIEFTLPKKDIIIPPRGEYFLTVSYISQSGLIIKNESEKRLQLRHNTFFEQEIESLKIIFPACFGMKIDYIEPIYKPTYEQFDGDNHVLTYENYLANASFGSEEYSTKSYDPTIRFKYSFDIFELLLYLGSSIFVIFLGIFIEKWYRKRKKEK